MIYIYIAVDALIIFFFIIERILRKGNDAKTFEKSKYDKRSTNLLGFSFVISTMLIIYAPLLNHYKIGTLKLNLSYNMFGIFIMLLGISIRIIAAITLGRFYTRTLRKTDNHELISTGIYKYVRHPGYLGTILLNIGAGISVGNIFSLLIVIIPTFSSYIYRIKVEEKMLIEIFGDKYRAYTKWTKKLIPFIY
jgi:protein-S-isoprenylcysteine O-methyltransferase Ste14